MKLPPGLITFSGNEPLVVTFSEFRAPGLFPILEQGSAFSLATPVVGASIVDYNTTSLQANITFYLTLQDVSYFQSKL